MSDLAAAKRLRLHAQRLRTIALEKHDPDIRQTLFELVVDCEHMATSMEALDRTNKRLRKVRNENGR